MTAFAEYLLKVIICSGVLTGYYWLALRNKLFHSWNRYYLLIAVITSLLLPLIKISFGTEPQARNLPAYTILQTVTTNEVWFPEKVTAETETFSKEQVSIMLYVLVSIALFITLIITLLRINKLITAYEHWKMKNLTFVDTDAKGTPFSFLHYIFWNREIDFESAQGQQIFKHELIHVKEKHSIDKLFLQLVLIVFWINPFFWIIRKELTMIHEFIADRKSVKDSDASALAAMILTAAFPGHTILTNPFFYSPVKRRLLMLSKLQNPKVGYISRLLLLPLLTILFTAFAIKIKENDRPSSIPHLENQLTVVIDAGHGFRNGTRHGAVGLNGISEDEIALAITKKIQQLNTDKNLKLIFTRKDEKYVERMERLQIAKENKADLLISIHANYAPPLRTYDPSPKTVSSLTENPANGFEVYVSNDNNPYQQMSKNLGSAIINEVKSLTNIREPGIRQRTSGIWIVDAASFPAIVLECGYISNPKDLAFITNEKNQEKIAEAVLKGIVNYASNRSEASIIKQTNILTDTVPLPDSSKKSPVWDSTQFKKIANSDQLVIINGKKADKKMRESLKISTVKRVTIIKENDKEAILKYGPEAKNGVIVFEEAIIEERKPTTETEIPASTPIFTKAEVMPEFQGGENSWNRYMEKIIKDNIEALISDGKEGSCEVEFIVSPEGYVTSVKAKTMHNTMLANVFVEAIKKGPKWIPAIQNGRKVYCKTTQKLVFRLPPTKNIQSISIANAYMQNLFMGIDNPLVISIGNTPGSQLQVTSNNGTVAKVNGTWVARPSFEGKAVITVTDPITNQEMKVVFTAKQLAVPAITWENQKEEELQHIK
jgi:N-acetylmuramoyl-L-alanine amidase